MKEVIVSGARMLVCCSVSWRLLWMSWREQGQSRDAKLQRQSIHHTSLRELAACVVSRTNEQSSRRALKRARVCVSSLAQCQSPGPTHWRGGALAPPGRLRNLPCPNATRLSILHCTALLGPAAWQQGCAGPARLSQLRSLTEKQLRRPFRSNQSSTAVTICRFGLQESSSALLASSVDTLGTSLSHRDAAALSGVTQTPPKSSGPTGKPSGQAPSCRMSILRYLAMLVSGFSLTKTAAEPVSNSSCCCGLHTLAYEFSTCSTGNDYMSPRWLAFDV